MNPADRIAPKVDLNVSPDRFAFLKALVDRFPNFPAAALIFLKVGVMPSFEVNAVETA